MDKPTETFGAFIKSKRLSHQPRLTLKKTAEMLELNITYLSDVENARKKPFSAEKIELFCEKLGLSDEDRTTLYDLAARDNDTVPEDIRETIMYSPVSDYARKALRLVKQGNNDVELWKELIRKMEGDA